MRTVLLAMLVIVSGCSMKVDTPPPEVPAPDGWAYAQADGKAPPARWWTTFGSEELDRLVELALANNPDIAGAAARLRRADAQLTIAGAGLWPRLGLGVDGRRSGSTDGGESTTRYDASLSASYEIDLWGGLRADRAAAAANLEATLYDEDTVRTTVVASVVETWLRVRALRERLVVANENLKAAEQVLEIVRVRYENGATTALALAQQQAQVAGQRAALAPLMQQEREALAALALLLGQPPQAFDIEGRDMQDVRMPEAISSLPAQVLARRPDVRRAEAALHGAQADVHAARAALFPQLTLTGSLAAQGARLGDLLSGGPAYALGASVFQAIFQGGRIRARGEAAEAFYEELAQRYVETVLNALAEADLALSDVRSLAEQARWQREQVEQAYRALELAQIRYRAGSEDLLTVLDAQRTLFGAQDRQLQLRLAELQSRLTLYRTLGAVPPREEGRPPLSSSDDA